MRISDRIGAYGVMIYQDLLDEKIILSVFINLTVDLISLSSS